MTSLIVVLLCLGVILSKLNLIIFCSINIYLESQKPYEFYEKGFHGNKVTACEAMGVQGIIGPFLFEIARATATINSDRYAADLGRFWRSLGEMFGQAFCLNKLLKQDRVSIHSSCVSLDWFGGELLREFSADVPTIPGV